MAQPLPRWLLYFFQIAVLSYTLFLCCFKIDLGRVSQVFILGGLQGVFISYFSYRLLLFQLFHQLSPAQEPLDISLQYATFIVGAKSTDCEWASLYVILLIPRVVSSFVTLVMIFSFFSSLSLALTIVSRRLTFDGFFFRFF